MATDIRFDHLTTHELGVLLIAVGRAGQPEDKQFVKELSKYIAARKPADDDTDNPQTLGDA